MPELAVTWDDRGLVPAVVQHHRTGEILMLAWMNREAFDLTMDSGSVHFWSRSRRKLWRKGETSGNTLRLVEVLLDCDRDTLVLQVLPSGPACHTGRRTCFVGVKNGLEPPKPQGFADLESLWQTIAARVAESDPGSYTARLAEGGPSATGRKVIEEAAEVAEAGLHHRSARADDRRLAEEAADLIYHLLVLLAERRVTPEQPLNVLGARRRPRSR